MTAEKFIVTVQIHDCKLCGRPPEFEYRIVDAEWGGPIIHFARYRGIVYWGKMFAKKKLFAPVRFVSVKLLNLLYRVIHSHPVYKSFFENLRKVE